MSEFKLLPAHEAQALGQLLHATLEGRADTALSEDAAPAPSWGQLARLRSTAAKAQPPRPDVALSAPRWEPSTPAPANKAPTRLVVQESPQTARARKIAEHEAIQRFEAKYGVGTSIEEAREQDLADDYLKRMGL